MNANGLVAIVLVLIILLILAEAGRATRKLKGRTTREFQSKKNIWPILDQWADMRNYKLVKMDENSRTYLKRGLRPFFLIPKVQIRRDIMGYNLDASLVLPVIRRIIGLMWFLPSELVIDHRSFWIGFGDWHPMDPRHIASMDMNTLIDMIDAGIEPIP